MMDYYKSISKWLNDMRKTYTVHIYKLALLVIDYLKKYVSMKSQKFPNKVYLALRSKNLSSSRFN